MVDVTENWLHGRQGPMYLHSGYHCCWWPGDTRSHQQPWAGHSLPRNIPASGSDKLKILLNTKTFPSHQKSIFVQLSPVITCSLMSNNTQTDLLVPPSQLLTSVQYPGPWFNIKMTSYRYKKSHCGDKTVVRSSYLHNGISYTGKMTSLYWIRALLFLNHVMTGPNYNKAMHNPYTTNPYYNKAFLMYNVNEDLSVTPQSIWHEMDIDQPNMFYI